MKFTSKNAQKRFIAERNFAYNHDMIDNFNKVFMGLLAWERFDEDGDHLNEILIGSDYDDHCFSFREVYSDGHTGVVGGIIFHGTPELGYVENGSVCISPSYGWQIHT